jgi:UDP-N-acetyl-D-mannosaminuronic acid transferase (WecB/TagA/CpsF family)
VVRNGVAETGPGVINVRRAGHILELGVPTAVVVALNQSTGTCGQQLVDATATRTSTENWTVTYAGGSAGCADGTQRVVLAFSFTATITGAQ